MPYTTDERLKSYLDTNQLHREQMCRTILALDKRFIDVKSRHPRGGRDGGRDIEAIFMNEQVVFGAVGFINTANDSKEQKKQINSKFKQDIKSSIDTEKKAQVFVFFTNINFTIDEKENLIVYAKKNFYIECEIFDRERIRIALDGVDGFATRFQYLNIPLSEAEQATFFGKWGDNINSLISSGFQTINKNLSRMLFLQEADDTIKKISVVVKFIKEYTSDEIGHFRAFCSILLEKPTDNILAINFGIHDKHYIMNKKNADVDINYQYDRDVKLEDGYGGIQWINEYDSESKGIIPVNSKNHIDGHYNHMRGQKILDSICLEFTNNSLRRKDNHLIKLKDLDCCQMYLFLNKTLYEKIEKYDVYSNGYKLCSFKIKNMHTREYASEEIDIPVKFTEKQLNDKWIRLSDGFIDFYQNTPLRNYAFNAISQ